MTHNQPLQTDAQSVSEMSICLVDIEKAMQRGHQIRSSELRGFFISIRKITNKFSLSLTTHRKQSLSVGNDFKTLPRTK